MKCLICGNKTIMFSEAQILRKYRVKYYQCTNCSFVQTEKPYWLTEAYSKAITDQDIGMVGRNINLANFTSVVISFLLKKGSKYLDFGGGYGLFVRLMRNNGYDYYRYDKYCENLFAKGFDINDATTQNFDLVTAFEVLEHLEDPLHEIRKMLRLSKNLLFSTAILPDSNPRPGEWWYYGAEHGQHLSIFSMKSLQELANTFNLYLYSNKKGLHLFSDAKISTHLFELFSHNRCYTILGGICKRKSLLEEDYHKVTGCRLSC